MAPAQFLQYVLVISLLLICAVSVDAQDKSRPAPTQMETKPTNCEFHIATLDAAHDQAQDGLVAARKGRVRVWQVGRLSRRQYKTGSFSNRDNACMNSNYE